MKRFRSETSSRNIVICWSDLSFSFWVIAQFPLLFAKLPKAPEQYLALANSISLSAVTINNQKMAHSGLLLEPHVACFSIESIAVCICFLPPICMCDVGVSPLSVLHPPFSSSSSSFPHPAITGRVTI